MEAPQQPLLKSLWGLQLPSAPRRDAEKTSLPFLTVQLATRSALPPNCCDLEQHSAALLTTLDMRCMLIVFAPLQPLISE